MDGIFTVILSLILIATVLTLLLLVDFLLVDTAREMSTRFIGGVLSILFGLFVTFMIFILYYVVTGGQPDCQ